MSKSYIPRNTLVVCTNMTVSKPLKLEHEHRSTVIHKSSNNQLLNIDDKKISDAFVCKNPKKFWGGLGAMLLGIAAGIVIGAAIVATGGAAAVAILAIAATTAAGGIGCIMAGEIKAHDCDVSKSGQWQSYHRSVFIDKKNALLQSSILPCSQGGIISIVPNPILAQQMADIYANNNNKELAAHSLSQFTGGIITGITFLGSPIAAVAGGGMGMYFYNKNESDGLIKQSQILNAQTVEERTFEGELENQLNQEKYNQPVGVAIGAGEAATEVVKNQMIPINQRLNQQVLALERQALEQEARAARLAANGATEQAGIVAGRAANTRLAADIANRSYRMPYTLSGWRGLNLKPTGVKFATGLGVGLAGMAVNFGIEWVANGYEDDKFDVITEEFRRHNQKANISKKGINILSRK